MFRTTQGGAGAQTGEGGEERHKNRFCDVVRYVGHAAGCTARLKCVPLHQLHPESEGHREHFQPTPDQQQRLFVQLEPSPEQSRAITRLWQKFRTAQ